MLNRRGFDLVFAIGILTHGALGLLRLETRRLQREAVGVLNAAADTVQVVLR